MGFTWQVTPTEAFGKLSDRYKKDIDTAVFALAQRYAPEIESWMKSNAKWTDRTGNARQSLTALALQDLAFDLVTIFLSYGSPADPAGELEYGIFLELSNGGRYAIIGPAIDEFAPKIWADVQRLFS